MQLYSPTVMSLMRFDPPHQRTQPSFYKQSTDLNFKNLSQLLSFALGLLKLFLFLELFLGLVLLLNQGLELTRQLSGELQGLEHLLVLGDGQLLVSV